MKLFKKILKIFGVLITLGLVAFGILYAVYNKALPEARSGLKADALAQKMLNAVNNEAYQSTRFIEWSFIGGSHNYKWDKVRGHVKVKWDDISVDLNLYDTAKSSVTKENSSLTAKESRDIWNTAWGYFNNDSFWLVAPFKVFDEGTERSIVKLEDGTERLLVTYTGGGSTPGDSYLWKLNSNGFPESYQMWVKVIPFGGLEATWDDWQVMESGVFLPTKHKFGPMTLDMGKVRAYN